MFVLGVCVTPTVTIVEKIASTGIRTPVPDMQGECSTTELWRLVISTLVAGL